MASDEGLDDKFRETPISRGTVSKLYTIISPCFCSHMGIVKQQWEHNLGKPLLEQWKSIIQCTNYSSKCIKMWNYTNEDPAPNIYNPKQIKSNEPSDVRFVLAQMWEEWILNAYFEEVTGSEEVLGGSPRLLMCNCGGWCNNMSWIVFVGS